MGEDAKKVKEQNTYAHFYNMKNSHGVEVRVAVPYVRDALKRGFQHIDNVVQFEDPKDHIAPPTPKSESERMAEAMEKVAEAVKPEGKKKKERTPEEIAAAKARMAKARAGRKKKEETEE